MPQFGTSGLRGLAVDLTDPLVAAYSTAFLSRVPNNGTVLIGRDLRDSSPRILRAVAAGALRAGLRPLDCGVLPTPALALAAGQHETAAIMVTGSHIPGDRNGLKFYDQGAEIGKDDEAWLTEGAGKVMSDPLPDVGKVETDRTAQSAFLDRYMTAFGEAALSGFRIGIFEHSSAARDVLSALITGLGGTPIPLGRSETFVAVDTEAVSEDARARVSDWVQAHRLDAIVSTDGDADRPMLVDETGQVIPGDRLGPLTAAALGAESIVTPVSANTLVDLMADWTVIRTKIGSPYVIAAMENAGAARVVGYEPNGGFLLAYEATLPAGPLPALMTRDFALPLLAVLSRAKTDGITVSALSASLPPRYTATDRLTDVPTEISRKIGTDIKARDVNALPITADEILALDTTDGVRLTLTEDRLLTVRPSGNAPELRCYVEAPSQAKADALLQAALITLRQAAAAAR